MELARHASSTSAFLNCLCHVTAGAGPLWHEIVFQVMPITGNHVKQASMIETLPMDAIYCRNRSLVFI
jgi:hypothetical protein